MSDIEDQKLGEELMKKQMAGETVGGNQLLTNKSAFIKKVFSTAVFLLSV